ncbi:MAG: hypothetical protein RI897_2759 [Verrucomicrobiota bacterium]|jgi:dihydroneopterin aldolase
MMDRIRIVDLEVWARVGVPEVERSRAQRLLLSVELHVDVGEAAASDDLSRTVDYGAVSRRLVAWLGEGSWRLIESMAVGVVELLKAEFGVGRVRVEVKKFVVPQARYVSVEVER